MSDTKARMVKAAGALFMADGVSGTGTAAILDHAAAPRGSLYHHFPGGKSELVVAALEDSGLGVDRMLEAVIAGADGPASAIRTFVGGWATALEASGWRNGCPVTTAALELAATDDAVRDACGRAYGRWQSRLVSMLSTGPSSQGATADAEFMLALLEGALVLARVRQDRAPLDAAAERIIACLGL